MFCSGAPAVILASGRGLGNIFAVILVVKYCFILLQVEVSHELLSDYQVQGLGSRV